MAQSNRSLFVAHTTTADPTYNISWTISSNLTGVKVEADSPPTSNDQATIFLELGSTTSAQTITVYMEPFVGTGFGSGSGWSGVMHKVTNIWRTVSGTDGSTEANTFSTDTSNAVFATANLYEQAFWKLNRGFRIILASNGGSDAITAYGAVIFK